VVSDNKSQTTGIKERVPPFTPGRMTNGVDRPSIKDYYA
jgi:hypothetical protein